MDKYIYIYIIIMVIKYLIDISFNHVIYISKQKKLHLKNIHYVLRNAVLYVALFLISN